MLLVLGSHGAPALGGPFFKVDAGTFFIGK